MALPFDDCEFKGVNSSWWLRMDTNGCCIQVWILDMEKERFELTGEFQLTSAEIKEMRDEDRSGSFAVSLVNIDHFSVETVDTLRILSINDTIDEEPNKVAISKPEYGFSYILVQQTLLTAEVTADVRKQNLELLIQFHDLESNNGANDIMLNVAPKVVSRVHNDPLLLQIDVRQSFEDKYALIGLTLRDNVTRSDDTPDVVQEQFYFVINVPQRSVHSRGWSQWEEVLSCSEQKFFLLMDKGRFEVR